MKTRNVAIAIFYDKDLNIILQERGEHSRVGEKYGFWGGRIKENETSEQAIKRELSEELGFVPKKLDYWLKYSYIVEEESKYKNWLINCEVFLLPITPKLEKAKISEGKRLVKMSLDEVVKGKGFPKHSTDFINGLKTKLRDKKVSNIKFRRATLADVEAIQKIEKEYYEGFSADEKVLQSWIETLPENFILAEDRGKVVGFIFVEYFEKPKALPFIHDVSKTHKRGGKYLYVSEVGVLDKHGVDLMQTLFGKAVKKAKDDGVRFAVWLTGGKSKHDRIELEVLRRESFEKKKQVKNWEAYPNYFVSDHWIWMKKL